MSEQKKKKLRREEFLECLGVNENKVNKGKKQQQLLIMKLFQG